MAGYYDETTGEYIDDGGDYTGGGGGFGELDDTSGTGSMENWSYLNGVWTDPKGTPYDMRYLNAAEQTSIGGTLQKLGGALASKLTGAFTKQVNGKSETDWRAVAAAAGGLYGLYQSQKTPEKTGYQGGIPQYEAVREQVPNTYDPGRRPGSGGQKYFTDTKYVAPADAASARTTAKEEAAGIEAANKANPARQTRPVLQAGAERQEAAKSEIKPASSVIDKLPVPKYASGGIAEMAKGRYLAGATDGMADKIPARIGGKQEAKLSHGEFVIPADVVGHLGNGNSEAGAQRLYAMMDRIRKARTGTTKQGKQINPDKFLA
jgi:hypothetical protein